MKSIVVFIALLVFTTAQAITTQQSCCVQPTPTTLSFSITKQGEVDPDCAQVSITISHTTLLMSESFSNVSLTTQDFFSSIISLGVPKDNITTTAFSTSPVYNYTYVNNVQQQIFVGYQTQNSLNINVNLNSTGIIISAAANYPLISIQDVSFSVSDQVINAKQQELLAECSASATQQAQITLKPLNQTLKKYLSITTSLGSGQNFNPQPRFFNAKFANADMEAPAAAPIQISGTKTKVTATISYTVEYE